jgi:Domain of unknown function (DUF1707)
MSPELRIGDAERDAAVAALSEHFAAGRLSKDEFDERTTTAWTARTLGDVAPLFVDLPAPHPPASVSTTPALSRPGSARSRRLVGSFPLAPLLVIALVVLLLRLADQTPWFAFAIVVWLWCIGRFHASRHHPWRRSRHHCWHQSLRQ